jgi:hypothetical protein
MVSSIMFCWIASIVGAVIRSPTLHPVPATANFDRGFALVSRKPVKQFDLVDLPRRVTLAKRVKAN